MNTEATDSLRPAIYADLRRVLEPGLYLVKVDQLKALPTLPACGGSPAQPAAIRSIRLAIKKAIGDLGAGSTSEQVALRLFGLTEDSAGASLMERYRIAGEIPQLPRRLLPGAIRRRGGLRDQILYELAEILSGSSGRTAPRVHRDSRDERPADRQGHGYEHLLAELDVRFDPDHERRRIVNCHFKIQATRTGVDVWRYVWHQNRGLRLLSLSVDETEEGHREIGQLPVVADEPMSPVALFVLLDRPLRTGETTDIRITTSSEPRRIRPGPAIYSHPVGGTPCEVAVRVHLPLERFPAYRQIQRVRYGDDYAILKDESVARVDSTPMTYHEVNTEPFVSYGVAWDWPA